MSDKRYLVFKSKNYEASGGMSDKVADFEDLDTAIKEALSMQDYDESHIYDRISGKVVWTKEGSGLIWEDIPAINDKKLSTREELADKYVIGENIASEIRSLSNGQIKSWCRKDFLSGYDAALSCFREAPVESLLLNALMLLDDEGLKLLADSIYSRIPK